MTAGTAPLRRPTPRERVRRLSRTLAYDLRAAGVTADDVPDFRAEMERRSALRIVDAVWTTAASYLGWLELMAECERPKVDRQ